MVFKKTDHNDQLAINCPDASCSPLKAQQLLKKNGLKIACFEAADTSPVFRGFDPDFGYKPEYVVKWISIKRNNTHQLNAVDIFCLPRTYPLTQLN